DRTKRTPFSQAKLPFRVLAVLCSRSIHSSRFMLHVPSFWDVGRSRNTSCFFSSLTNLEMQYLILVRCRIVVHPWNTISPSPFRPRFFVCGPPFCDYPRYGEHRAEGWLLSGRRQRSRLEWPYRLN